MRIQARSVAIYATLGLLVCGLVGYLVAGNAGRSTGSLVGAIAGAIYAALRAKEASVGASDEDGTD